MSIPKAATATDEAGLFLSVNNIEVVYSHVVLVLKGVSLGVPRGGIVALLGANGAGKTTTLKAISNLLHAERGEVTKGSILFDGVEVQSLSPNDLVRRGCIQVMEGRRCFAHLTVEENLLTGAFTRRDGKGWKIISDWYTANQSITEPLVNDVSAKYAADKKIQPRDCSKES